MDTARTAQIIAQTARLVDNDELAAEPFQSVDELELGQAVAVYSRGRQRLALVEKLGRSRVTVVYTTQGAIEQAQKIATLSRAATLRVRITHAKASAERYDRQAELTAQHPELVTEGRKPSAFTAWTPELERLTGTARPGNVSGQTIVFSAETLRGWAASERDGAAKAEAGLAAAEAYDARTFEERFLEHVTLTRKTVPASEVWPLLADRSPVA